MKSTLNGATTAALLHRAVAFHQAGNLVEAARLYDQILRAEPANADALNLKGLILADDGRSNDALALFDRAIAALPGFADVHFNKGNVLAALGRSDEALAAYDKAIALKPAYADARLNAGQALYAQGRLAEAVAVFRAGIAASPGDARLLYNLGVCADAFARIMKARNDACEAETLRKEAVAAFEQALAINPGNAEAHFTLANLLSELAEFDSAVTHAEAAVALKPAWPDALSNLGKFLLKVEKTSDGTKALRKALALSPANKDIKYNLATTLYGAKEYAEAECLFIEVMEAGDATAKLYVNFGNLCRDTDRIDEAIALFERALDVEPTLVEAYLNMSGCFSDKGWMTAAMVVTDKVLSGNPANPAALFKRAIVNLRLGRLAESLPDYEFRYDDPVEGFRRRLEPPRYWNGEDLRGRSVLIWTEQGKGDEILHGGMIRELAARAARCVLECSAAMAPIFVRSLPGIEVRAYTNYWEPATSPEGFDYQVSVASLARFFRTDFDKFPRHRGYLCADPAVVSRLRRRYEALAQGRRIVGVSWRSARQEHGSWKSATLESLMPVLKTPGVMFVNLQYGDCTEEIAALGANSGIEVIDDPEVDPLKDMDAFFAQVAAMDLVISTSNTTVHVAGALNIPVWILLGNTRGTLWYWFMKREDSPWYPSARLFRPSKLDLASRWEIEPVARAAAALDEWLKAGLAEDPRESRVN